MRFYNLDPWNLSRSLSANDRDRFNERQYFIHNNNSRQINPYRESDAVRIKFFGCNSLYITDGETNLLIDPFFTRPRANMNFEYNRRRLIRACPKIIEATLDYAQIRSAHGILLTHAHWDHALDVAEVWHALHPTNSPYPIIYGCSSIYNIALGGDILDEHIQQPVINRVFSIGKFKFCFIPGAHAPLPTERSHRASIGLIPSKLPVRSFTSARVDAYKQGAMVDILIEHPHGLILIKGSANFIPGLLSSFIRRYSQGTSTIQTHSRIPFIDVLILACAGFNTYGWASRALISRNRKYDYYIFNNFWHQVIGPTKPYLLLLSHWDRFTEGREDRLDRPPHWMQRAYECKFLFERYLRPPGTDEFRSYITRFIPFWEDITILPVYEEDVGTGRLVRRSSAFQLPPAGSRISI